MNQSPLKTHTTAISPTVLWVIGFGFILLLGVVMLKEIINTTFAATPNPPSMVQTTPISPMPAQSSMTGLQAVINQPDKYRILPTDVSPVASFVDGKTTKFLMGF